MNRISLFSPYRISFSGGGTDIAPFVDTHGGCVINSTIDKGVRISYVRDGEPLEISSRDFLRSWSFQGGNGNNFLDNISLFLERRGVREGRISISGDVPPGTGLGSSSALISGLLALVSILDGRGINREALARETYETEHNSFGVILGKQDPYAIAFGGFKFMRFYGDRFETEFFSNDGHFASLLEQSILIVYTGSSRESSAVLQEEVRKAKDGSEEFFKNLEEMKKVTEQMWTAIKREDMEEFTNLLNASWEIKKRFGAGITNKNIDRLIQISLQKGAAGAKLMGGGSQGFILLISKKGRRWELQREMMNYSNFVVRVSLDKDGIVYNMK